MKKIIAATSVTIFSLAVTFVGAYAWFASNQQTSVGDGQVYVVSKSAKIQSLNLIKFDYQYIGKVGDIELYDYLSPQTGEVHTYTYDSTYNSGAGAFVRLVNGVKTPTTIMTRYDPVDRIIHGGNLREMNCNAVYEVVIESDSFTNCYLQLDAIFNEKTPDEDQILLSDSVYFEVFYPSDLADNNPLFKDKDSNPATYNAYRPSFIYGSMPYDTYIGNLEDSTDDIKYHKLSYLSYLRNSNFTAEDLVELGLLTSEQIEGKTEEQKAQLVIDTVGPEAKNFYSQAEKDEVNLATNKQVTFSGTPKKTITAYININYCTEQLDQYSTDIYRKNLTAIEDFYFDFEFTESLVS